MSGFIVPDWPAPARVHALVSTRSTNEAALEAALPASPRWLRQVHGVRVVDLDGESRERPEGDAAITRSRHTVCAIQTADCLPVLLADEAGQVIGAAHAGWRGLSAGVIEATLDEMRVRGPEVIAWLGPAIGPEVYEVGQEVRAAFLDADAAAAHAFVPTRPGHWRLDLYAVARQRLRARGVARIFGGGFCTYSDAARFHSYRRERATGRMAALLWLG